MARRDRAASGSRRSREGSAGAGEGARAVPPEAVDRDAPRGRAGVRGTDARLLPLDVCLDVDTRPVRGHTQPRVRLPPRWRRKLAAGASGRAPAVLQLPDALAHLDS